MFQYRLARELGMTRRRLLSELDSAELSEWMAYYQLEPFGCPADDARHGIMAAMFYNANRGKGQHPKNADDFWLADKSKDRRKQTPDQQKSLLRTLGAMFGKK